MKLKANVIQHVEFEDLGNLKWALEKKGFEIRYFKAHSTTDLEYLENNISDLLIVLGGPIGVYDNKYYPFLKKEKKIIKKQIKANQPIIGICLGAQLIASVLGAKVYPGKTKEIGWGEVYTDDPKNNILLPFDKTNVLHWHGDTFDLPPKATRLLHSKHYKNQAFCVGKNILALQFHMEVIQSRVEDWLIGHANELFNTNKKLIEKIRANSTENINIINPIADKFWCDWISKTSLFEGQGTDNVK